MSFLQPWMLLALPLIALPIVIHLINQRRYQTIPWAAMMFLLAANRMSRGYARIRQWLILAMRMLAVAGLVFAVSRPLLSGWLALTGRADTTLVLLDRSPSMSQQEAGTNASKGQSGLQQLSQILALIGSSRWALVEGAHEQPQELESATDLPRLPETEPISTSTNLPALLETAYQYIQTNKTGQTEIWICSDLRKNDWDPDGGHWKSLRDRFLELPQQIRFHLLAYPEMPANNRAVRITGVRRHSTSDGAELLVSFRVTQEGELVTATAPIHFEIDGARSEHSIEVFGRVTEIQDHRIPLEKTQERGWGKISIPADANPADNEFYFAYDKPAPRQTLIVSDGSAGVRALELAAGISPDPSVEETTETISAEQLSAVEWSRYALVLWQAPLPENAAAEAVRTFLDRGGQVIFFGSREAENGEFLGVRWQSWAEEPQPISVENWRTDQDLLANTQSGSSLPVGDLQVSKYCRFSGEAMPMATLKDGAPLLARVSAPRGGAYFCATSAADADSSLALDGVVLYVMTQRALAAGAAGLDTVQNVVAGEASAQETLAWQPLAISDGVLSTDYAHHSGVYSAGEKLIAVNRAETEDSAAVLDGEEVRDLFQGLDFSRVDDRAGSRQALIEEVWRLFLVIMIAALIVESALCLPRKAAETPGTPPLARGFEQPVEWSEAHPTGTAS